MNDRHSSKKKKKAKKRAKQAKKDSSQNFLDECFAATGGARLGMRAQRSGGGKLRRAEAVPAKRARADETQRNDAAGLVRRDDAQPIRSVVPCPHGSTNSKATRATSG